MKMCYTVATDYGSVVVYGDQVQIKDGVLFVEAWLPGEDFEREVGVFPRWKYVTGEPLSIVRAREKRQQKEASDAAD